VRAWAINNKLIFEAARYFVLEARPSGGGEADFMETRRKLVEWTAAGRTSREEVAATSFFERCIL